MELVDGVSVNLIIKAPSQKIDDFSVTSGMDWSVHRIKLHLSEVYPSKPAVHHQKIIYLGKLLQDDSLLKDVLRVYDPDQTTHTLHLICTQTTSDFMHSSKPQQSMQARRSAEPETTSQPEQHLRHRHTRTETPPSTETQSAFMGDVSRGTGVGVMPDAAPAPAPAATDMPFMMPGAAYDPQQLLWLQHMYAQQMTAYMQYYHQPGYHGNVTGALPGSMDHHQVVAPAQEAAGNNQAVGGQAARPNQGGGVVRMNAGGGAVFDDEDEEEGLHRDWLDWLYTLSRLVVLFTIVYFYSTPTRFTLVIIFFLLFYLYQAGYLTVQRREAPQRPQAVPTPQPPQPQPQGDGAAETDADLDESEEEGRSAVPPPASIHPLHIMWTFFFNFFTSLVPQAPPGVNAN